MDSPRLNRLLPAVLVLLLVSGGCSLMQKLSARDSLNKGVHAYTAKNYEEAIEHFNDCIEKDPDLLAGYLYLATTYRAQFVPQSTSAENLARGRKAIEVFEDVLNKAGDDEEGKASKATAMANLAGIYSGMGDYESAKEWYRNRLQLEPDNPEPLYGIGTIDWQLSYDGTGMNGENVENLEEEELNELNGYVDEGIEALKDALEINPEYVDAMQYLNLLYREKAKLTTDEEAQREWEREADRLALNALEKKREQERAAEEARRRLMAGQEKQQQ